MSKSTRTGQSLRRLPLLAIAVVSSLQAVSSVQAQQGAAPPINTPYGNAAGAPAALGPIQQAHTASDGRVFPAGTDLGVIIEYNRTLSQQRSAPPAPRQVVAAPPPPVVATPPVAMAAPPAPVLTAPRPRPSVAGSGISRAEFAAAFNNAYPLSPTQIRQANVLLAKQERAKAYVADPPQVGSRVMKVSLAPGSKTPVVRLAPGILSTLVFTDSTGAPWPVLEVRSGSPSFVVQEPIPGLRTNIATVSAMRHVDTSNLQVYLEGAPAPLPITVVSGQRQADIRTDMQVQGYGPAAQSVEVEAGLTTLLNDAPDLQQILHGTPPARLRSVNVAGNMSSHVQAWSNASGSEIYLRTTMQLLSPGAEKAARAVDGTNVYMTRRAEVLTFMDRGNTYDVTLSGLTSPLNFR